MCLLRFGWTSNDSRCCFGYIPGGKVLLNIRPVTLWVNYPRLECILRIVDSDPRLQALYIPLSNFKRMSCLYLISSYLTSSLFQKTQLCLPLSRIPGVSYLHNLNLQDIELELSIVLDILLRRKIRPEAQEPHNRGCQICLLILRGDMDPTKRANADWLQGPTPSLHGCGL